MAKMYTLDEKLLVGVPEIRIGEKVYKVDDREKTVKKVMALYNNGDKKDIEKIDEMFKLAFEPAAAKEMKKLLEGCKNVTLGSTVTIRSAMTEENKAQLDALADELL